MSHRSFVALALVLAIVGLAPGAVRAQSFDWTYSPLTAFASGPAGPGSALFEVEPYCCPTTAVIARAPQDVTDRDYQSVVLGLQVPYGLTFEVLEVCYQVLGSSGASGIIGTRLTEMDTPDSATILVDDSTPRTSTSPTCYDIGVGQSFRGTATLHLEIALVEGEELLIGQVRLVG